MEPYLLLLTIHPAALPFTLPSTSPEYTTKYLLKGTQPVATCTHRVEHEDSPDYLASKLPYSTNRVS